MLQERDLIHQCLSGNRDAFRRLIEPHQDFVFRVALSVLDNREEAEEAAQDAFIRAYRGLGSFSGRVPLQAWLYRIAGSNRPERKATPAPTAIGAADAALMVRRPGICGNKRPDAEVERQDARIRLRATIGRLPRKLHEVVVLTYMEELACREVAEVLNIPEGTVKSRLHRAREKLKKEIGRQGLLD